MWATRPGHAVQDAVAHDFIEPKDHGFTEPKPYSETQAPATEATQKVLDQFEKEVQDLGQKMGLTKAEIKDVVNSVKSYTPKEEPKWD